VVARTALGRAQRLLLVGHLDTVPPDGNATPRLVGDELWGRGAADMLGAVAVFLQLAAELREPEVDLTYVFYAREEVAAQHSGLEEVFSLRPDLLAGDAAIIGEPTDGGVEAGCQGTARLRVTLGGRRAHTARAWMGRNAIHRLAPILGALAGYEERRPVISGLQFREALQAVAVEGGVAGNVVPDAATLTINSRFAPDRTAPEAFAAVEAVVAPFLEPGDRIELVECSDAARPGVDHPLLAQLASLAAGPVQPKLGWTDVARFSARGVPAVNFGPGDATLAHRADERVEADCLMAVYSALARLVTGGG
jgi:succinyl-diaminopimelate desuccinylase